MVWAHWQWQQKQALIVSIILVSTKRISSKIVFNVCVRTHKPGILCLLSWAHSLFFLGNGFVVFSTFFCHSGSIYFVSHKTCSHPQINIQPSSTNIMSEIKLNTRVQIVCTHTIGANKTLLLTKKKRNSQRRKINITVCVARPGCDGAGDESEPECTPNSEIAIYSIWNIVWVNCMFNARTQERACVFVCDQVENNTVLLLCENESMFSLLFSCN